MDMKIADVAGFDKLDLQFSTDEPEEECDYLVVGELEAANGYVGIQFVVCTYMVDPDEGGHWWTAPDGYITDDGLPMWDGSSDTMLCPFKPLKWAPLKWAKLPQPTDD
jgi:hypothetical protein